MNYAPCIFPLSFYSGFLTQQRGPLLQTLQWPFSSLREKNKVLPVAYSTGCGLSPCPLWLHPFQGSSSPCLLQPLASCCGLNPPRLRPLHLLFPLPEVPVPQIAMWLAAWSQPLLQCHLCKEASSDHPIWNLLQPIPHSLLVFSAAFSVIHFFSPALTTF